MTASVRILTTSTVDSSPAILLVSPDGSKILVNCGEGCQRSFLEYQQKLSTVQAVCLTHLSHDSIGGLPGMILTAADITTALVENAKAAAQGKPPTATTDDTTEDLPGLDLIGPCGTSKFVQSLRHFMRREKFQVKIQEGIVDGIRPGQLAKQRKKKKKDGDPDSIGFRIQSLAFCEQAQQSGRKRRHEPDDRQILSYLFRTPPLPGRFLPEEASKLGVPRGKLYGQLKAGQKVTFIDADGIEKTVESHQVVTPPRPGAAVMVLRYPIYPEGDEVKLKDFFSSIDIVRRKQPDDVTLDLVMHIATKSLFEHTESMQWRESLPSVVDHIFLDTRPKVDIDGTPFRSAAKGAMARSQVCSDIYQIPTSPKRDHNVETDGAYKLARPTMEYILIPRIKRGFSEQLTLPSANNDLQEASKLAEDSGALSLSSQILAACGFTPSDSNRGAVSFTGTGSAIPCKHRNVTGMCLTGLNENMMLLDIGEDTIGQLIRTESGRRPEEILSRIKAVWISHPHADHHLGILRLLHDRKSADPILLIAPAPLFAFLREYAFAIDPTIADTYVPVDCQNLVGDNTGLPAQLQRDLGITGCRTVPVTHCRHAFAVILDGTCFGRLVYSGDCRPSARLAQAGFGADLLIHEATFEDGMEAEAALKRHSTVGEALSIAKQMHAKGVILTHFSQRYPKIPPTPNEQSGLMPIVFAFDYMRITPHNLLIASKLTPALRLLCPEEETDDIEAKSTEASAMDIPGLFAQDGLL